MWAGCWLPSAAELTGHLLFRRDRAEREREQRAAGLARTANAQGGHHRPRGVKRGCLCLGGWLWFAFSYVKLYMLAGALSALKSKDKNCPCFAALLRL